MSSAHPEIILIMARADNGVVGNKGKMPWHLPADLRRFKQITMGKPMVMGRKTFDSLPGILEGRRHIVITRDEHWEEEGVDVAHSLEDAIRIANAPHIAVIGGAEIYGLFLDRADRIELTEIKLSPEGDARIAYPDAADWEESAREDYPALDGKPAYSFVTFRRKSAR